MKYLYFVALLIFYLFLSLTVTRKGNAELTVVPERILRLSQYQVGEVFSPSDKKQSIPFRLGSYFGFHDEDLNLLNYDVLTENLPSSQRFQAEDFYLDFESRPDTVVIRGVDNRELGSFIGDSRAFISKGEIFQLSNQGHTLMRYNREGVLQWYTNFLPYLTSMDNNPGSSVTLGFARDNISILDERAQLSGEYYVSGSRVNFVYGVASSPDQRYLAALAGLDPQRFIFLENRQGAYVYRYSMELDNQLRHTQWVQFSQNQSQVYYETSSGIAVYDYESKKSHQYHSEGKLKCFAEFSHENVQLFIMNLGNRGVLKMLNGARGPFLRMPLAQGPYSLHIFGDQLFYGQGDVLTSFSLKRL